MIYCAGPFFNPVQKATALRIRDLVKATGQDYCAPVEHGVTLDSPEKAQRVYEENVRGLLKCNTILVQLEWLLPDGVECRICQRAESEPESANLFLAKSGPLNLPDTGTVWELGFACAMCALGKGRPFIVAYTVGAQSKLNLMLARSCDAYLSGWAQVEEFIKTGIVPKNAHKWTGKEL